MNASSFSDRLHQAILAKKTPAMVGLDPRVDQLPAELKPASDNPAALANAYIKFCQGVINAVAPVVAIVKPQAAFFEQLGPTGMVALAEVIALAKEAGLLVLLDGKRNDIGSTAAAYADGYLGSESAWGADALTISPYLGEDSLTPFVKTANERQAGLFVLVRTSNAGAGMFQDLSADGRPAYEHVAGKVEALSSQQVGECGLGSVGAVVGATWPKQMVELRTLMPHCWFLVPGFGAQGGSAADTAGAFREDGTGAVVNSSRGIIFAYRREPYAAKYGEAKWQDAVHAAAVDMVQQLRDHTPAGNL